MTVLVVQVAGYPAPQGSKNASRTGRMYEASKRVKPWRLAVHLAAVNELRLHPDWEPYDVPVELTVIFLYRRPANHYGTGRNADTLKPGAPTWKGGTPDLDKLLRSTCDALTTAGVWRDDARVAMVTARKVWANRPVSAEYFDQGARIQIQPVGVLTRVLTP